MSKKIDLEILEEYLSGDLVHLQMKEVEAALSKDPILREELELLSISKEAIQLASWRRLITETQTSFLKNREVNSSQQIGLWRWISRIAASIAFIILVSSVIFFTTTSPKSITGKFIEFQIPVMRGDSNTLSDLEDAYQLKDFATIEKSRNQLNPDDPTTNFILAMVDLENNKPASAEELLKKAMQHNKSAESPVFKEETDYYLVQALLLQEKFEEAEAILAEIKSDPTHKYAKNFSSWDAWRIKVLKIKS